LQTQCYGKVKNIILLRTELYPDGFRNK